MDKEPGSRAEWARPGASSDDPDHRRFGRFTVDFHFLSLNEPSCRELMRKVIVVDARANWAMGHVEYMAFCEEFERIDFQSSPPLYRVLVRHSGNEPPHVWFERVL